jgi:hypothetical protein
MDATGVLAQLIQRAGQPGRYPAQFGVELAEPGRYRSLSRPKPQHK